MTTTTIDLLDELRWRGLLHQSTDEGQLREHLASGRRKIYAGFDPTADSLTIGNLVPIIALVHVARAGHDPIVLMGGGTGLIGDPSGKSAERQLMTRETVDRHITGQRRIFDGVFTHAGLGSPRVVNNADWLSKVSFLDALRDTGKHFSVNAMMQKESVKERLHNREQGISYTEFSYMILQAYDYRHLYEREGVTVQCGGSDQWGNITAGIELIRKSTAVRHGLEGRLDEGERIFKGKVALSHGFTMPLATKSDGGKFGKTESGAVWLTPDRTSPFAMHQFWLNTADDDVERFLKVFTLLGREEIESLVARHSESPGAREAQRTLANEATALVHGRDQAAAAEEAGRALFSGDIASLPEATFREVLAEAPSSEHPIADLQAGVSPVDLLVETGLASSKRQAREFLTQGSVSVNGRKIGLDETLGEGDLLHGSLLAIRRGKKQWHLTVWK
ncbi:MAG: tyrosine--tRNA ligase [Phycisphaerales bacterium]|nr:tyrosine--tRNA ligase [Phycisphaerales bacterium]